MRIVSGKYKGHALIAPKGQATRPTSDRARESLFNIIVHASWAPALNDAHVIDLFAGSGALGLEALSHGAMSCLFVETDASARGAIRTNIEALQAEGITRLHRRSATALGTRPATVPTHFDIAFLDPPYDQGFVIPALTSLHEGDWLTDAALVVVETAASEALDLEGWEILDTRAQGAARLTFLRRA
jgi:16S rRNA (guanine966-N2)-methyltransferase